MSEESLENMLGCTKAQQERKTRPNPEDALKCPRCESSNTKFCYYNNYSLSQPRYFCKSCRRYWTKGGTLRNVPVGGGCRKNKRSSSIKAQPNSNNNNNHNSLTSLPHHHLSYDATDCDYFTLPLTSLQKQSTSQLGYNYHYNFNHNDHDLSILGNPTSSLCDILAQSGFNPLSIRNGFLETQNSLHSLYSVCGSGDMGEVVDNGNGSCGVEMMVPNYDQSAAVTNVKQESEMKMLEGSPWQLNGDANMGQLDSGRPSWNNTFTSSWHALLHSPLM